VEDIYYESDEYEDLANPGTYAAIVVTRCEDGVHFKFMSGELTIVDLDIPACEGLAIAYELGRASQDTLDAARRPAHQLPAEHDHVEHPRQRPVLPGDETTYGPREVGPADRQPVTGPYRAPHEVTGKPEPVQLGGPGHRYEMPDEISGYSGSWMRQPGAAQAGPPPGSSRRTA
jgi:hypothetical protein